MDTSSDVGAELVTGNGGNGQVKRRGIIAGVAAVLAGALASLSQRVAHAADGGNMIIAANNTETGTTQLTRTGGFNSPAFVVNNNAGTAVQGQSDDYFGVAGVAGPSNTRAGVIGVGGLGAGVAGVGGSSTSSVAVYGYGPGVGVAGNALGAGYGGYFETASGVGVYATGSSTSVINVLGTGPGIGVYGLTTSNQTGVAGVSASGIGVYAESTSGPNALYVQGNAFINGNFVAQGTKSAVVPGLNGMVTLYAMESPENWFEDFGTARLIGGRAEVQFEPGFAATVRTDPNDYHVFITEYGDNNGLFVSRKSKGSFEVQAKDSPTASTTFSYRIVARRRDVAVGLRLAPVAAGDRPSLPRVAPRLPQLPELPKP